MDFDQLFLDHLDGCDVAALVDELADVFDVDRVAARNAAEFYLEQIELNDERATMRVIDRTNISAADATAVVRAYAAQVFTFSTASQVDALTEASERVEAAKQEYDAATRERILLVRKALDSGVPLPQIVSASGLSRARIYQIKDDR